MLSTNDLTIIDSFLKANIVEFSRFCIKECTGIRGTGLAIVKHVENALNASKPLNATDIKSNAVD